MELEFPLQNVECLILSAVDMRRWTWPGGTIASIMAKAPLVSFPLHFIV